VIGILSPHAEHHTVPYPLTDLSLAQRLERTEAMANVAFVEARAQVEPSLGATWIEIAGVHAMFDGPQSPLTQTFGLGLFDAVGDAELAALEAFFHDRQAPVFHEVSPLIAPDLLTRLGARGYQPAELSTVLIRPTNVALGSTPDSIAVRHVGIEDVDLWSNVSGQGWSSESPELAAMIAGFGQVIGRARGTHCFLAEREGSPIAAAALSLNSDVALLAGASTIPASRKQGAQLALLHARLRFAAERGAQLAMMVALPGSGSQRNAERQGFRTCYTRTKWRLRSDT
jgi:hypothetical protein